LKKQNLNFVFDKKKKNMIRKIFNFEKSFYGKEAQNFIFKICFYQKA
jgi:hypothetical protein